MIRKPEDNTLYILSECAVNPEDMKINILN